MMKSNAFSDCVMLNLPEKKADNLADSLQRHTKLVGMVNTQ